MFGLTKTVIFMADKSEMMGRESQSGNIKKFDSCLQYIFELPWEHQIYIY